MKRYLRIIALAALMALLTACGTNSENPEQETEEIQMSQYTLSNPNATETTRKVYDYICTLGTTGTLSAQQESTWMGSVDYEMDYLLEATGKLPAMRGLDYMHDDFGGVNERAIEWWNEGGLVTIMWHTGCDFSGEWADALADEITDWDATLTPGTGAYDNFVKGMDKAAEALLELQDLVVHVQKSTMI